MASVASLPRGGWMAAWGSRAVQRTCAHATFPARRTPVSSLWQHGGPLPRGLERFLDGDAGLDPLLHPAGAATQGDVRTQAIRAQLADPRVGHAVRLDQRARQLFAAGVHVAGVHV